MHKRNFYIFEPSSDGNAQVVQSIFDIGKAMGLEVNGERGEQWDVQELVYEYTKESTFEDLQDLLLEVK